ncbi:MAG: hypothetical protein JL50_10600 [Peptococcaceae bacterium BICA1-7]|nr:MAG: hypothetical protein JL50_10600 [Peptococcaceae bacterium BICA1-7]HBV95733.1 hypothetical protein [Desulfotomaculum sp.]
MKSFVKGIVAGTLLGVLATMLKPSRKPGFKDIGDMVEKSRMGKKTGKMVKGMSRTVDRIMRTEK